MSSEKCPSGLIRAIAGQRCAGHVVVGEEVLRLHRPVFEQVRLRGRSAVEVVNTELSVVLRTIPAVAGRDTVVRHSKNGA